MRIRLLVVFCLSVASAIFGNPLPTPYTIVACGGPAQPACTVHGVTNGQPVPGLTESDFQTFFTTQLGQPITANYSWVVRDVNSSGVAIGSVEGGPPARLHTSFVFDRGQVICCTVDDPFFLADINDNGFVVGQRPVQFPSSGFVADCCSGLLSGQVPLALTFTSRPPFFVSFSAIDSADDISAFGFGGQRYDLLAAPEPNSMTLLAGVLIVTGFVVGQRGRPSSITVS
jgi:hypothetical protein